MEITGTCGGGDIGVSVGSCNGDVAADEEVTDIEFVPVTAVRICAEISFLESITNFEPKKRPMRRMNEKMARRRFFIGVMLLAGPDVVKEGFGRFV